MSFKSIISHINVLNLLLLTVTAAFASYVLPSFLNMKVDYNPPTPGKVLVEKEEKPSATQSLSAAEYIVVAEQNVFSPERKIPTEKKDEKPLPKPEFVLYGTLVTGDTSIAFLEDLKAPEMSKGRGKRQRTLRIGNSLSGYTLSEIYPERVVMVRGEDRMELRVLDASQAKRTGGGAPGGTVAPGTVAHAAAPPAQKPIGISPVASRANRMMQRQEALQKQEAFRQQAIQRKQQAGQR